MQFQVPQFIEVEDKIFGPLTFKQFVYITGACGMAYMMWRLLPLILAAPVVLGILAFGSALAFFQYNGRPFILALEHGFFFLTRSKLYLWSNNRPLAKRKQGDQALQAPDTFVPKLSESKLHELAWSLDIKERIAAGVAGDEARESPVSGLVAPVRTAREARVQ